MVHNDVVDLEKLIIDYIKDSPLKKRAYPNAEVLPNNISWLHVRIRHDDAVYTNTGEASKPSANVLFSSTFENNTDKTQVYTLKTERSTSTVCTFSLNKAYCHGDKISIKLTAPMIEAGGGLDRQMTVEKMNEHSFTQQMTWAVDNQVSVPSGYKTKADLIILENEYEGKFTSAVHYSGNINVLLKSKDKSGTLTVDVTDIFDEDNGFIVEDGVSTFIYSGSCKCRYGIEQSVKLTQEKIKDFHSKIENGFEST